MKDRYCSYYTESEDITSYMVSKLCIAENDLILEPSAGEGTFIDAIISQRIPVRIDALDMNESAVLTMQKKYANMQDVTVRLADTLLDEQLDGMQAAGGHYDKVIGNPPYGAWQDTRKRELLKKKYAGQYVKETYTLFLLRSLSVMKTGGRLSFIIPDTFLFLNMHEGLRKQLLTGSKIEEILIFPSYFFPGISFGYSNLSMITVEKCEKQDAPDNTIRIIKGFRTPAEFREVLQGRYQNHHKVYELKQGKVYASEKCRFLLAEEELQTVLDRPESKLGDVADIVTGFYSGDNRRFLRVKRKEVKHAKGYRMIDTKKVYDGVADFGIEGVKEAYVPYIKGTSATRYLRTEDEWFLRWDHDTVKHYQEDKKARFQNAQYYFKRGIAIPMVKSRTLNATVMEGRVFDQSVVGVFPKQEKDFYYILALMNSDAINKLIHIINPTANNSSNYVKQLPYQVPPEEVRKEIEGNVLEILSLNPLNDLKDAEKLKKLHARNNELIEKLYSVKVKSR